MLKYSITLLVFVLSLSSLKGQSDNEKTIRSIRMYYYQTKKEIKAAEESDFPDYYLVRMEENLVKMPMPAVGEYFGTTDYWYRNDEENNAFGRDGILVFKNSTFQNAARKEYREFLFRDGKLVFCFLNIAGSEYRYYFKEDQLVSFVAKPGEDNFEYYSKSDWENLLQFTKY